jgi:hypothetical protein
MNTITAIFARIATAAPFVAAVLLAAEFAHAITPII